MKKIAAILIIILACTLDSTAQADTTFKLFKKIPGDIVNFAVDNLDNIYIVNSRNQIKKLNANGDSVAVFNDVKKYGKATFLDVSNPLRLLVYYRDFATVVVLDRFLNAINTIDLRKQNILQAKAIALSYDNKVWVYDEVENKLKKVDDNGVVVQETADFRQLFGQAPVPQIIVDQDKYVYLYDPQQSVFVFDYYGALKNKIAIRGWQNFKVAGKYMFGSNNDTLHRYEISNFRLNEWKMPEEIYKSSSFNFSSTRLYALKKDVLEIYDYK